jgi:hypothetical protein
VAPGKRKGGRQSQENLHPNHYAIVKCSGKHSSASVSSPPPCHVLSG